MLLFCSSFCWAAYFLYTAADLFILILAAAIIHAFHIVTFFSHVLCRFLFNAFIHYCIRAMLLCLLSAFLVWEIMPVNKINCTCYIPCTFYAFVIVICLCLFPICVPCFSLKLVILLFFVLCLAAVQFWFSSSGVFEGYGLAPTLCLHGALLLSGFLCLFWQLDPQEGPFDAQLLCLYCQ